MNKASYSEAFVEQALSKVYQRDRRTIRSVAEELNINMFTLKGWMKRTTQTGKAPPVAREKRPQDWSLSERLIALQESYGLADEPLNAWCREKGLFAHHLSQWRTEFCHLKGTAPLRSGVVELRELKEENHQLKRELSRKEKALAEAAALLVLQKKYRALLGGEVE